MFRTRIVACVGAVVLLLAGSGVATAEAGDASWGWVVVRSPAKTYEPGSKDHRTSAGTSVSVTHSGTGAYSVTLHAVGAIGGTTLVTSMDGKSLCHPDAWNASPADEQIEVRCFSLTGVPRDSAFSLSWYAITSAPAGSTRNAYVWANDPSSTAYIPPAPFSFNGMGGTNTVYRTGTGRYVVVLGAMAKAGGQPQVTAYGTATGTCRVEYWQVNGLDIRVSVICRKASGTYVNQAFDLSFTNKTGLLGFDRPVAYLWADRPSTTSYHPSSTYRYSDPKVTITITRASKGVYSVTLDGAPMGGVAQVTAHGPDKVRCVLDSIRRTGAPQRIGVRCFGSSGQAADSPFTLSYAK